MAKVISFTDEEMEELKKLQDECRLRGVDYLGIEVDDWREIPTSEEDLEKLDEDDQFYWKSLLDFVFERGD